MVTQRRRPRALCGAPARALVLAFAISALGLPPASAAGGRFADLTLADALLELAARDLPVVFTSETVRPEMRVAEEPTARDPRLILDQLLAPHDLTVVEGARGSLIVVRQAPPEPRRSILGTVQSRLTLEPLPGAVVRVEETGDEATAGADGRFRILGLGAGTYTLEAQLRDHLPAEALGVVVAADRPAVVAFTLHPVPFIHDEVVVRPSQIELLEAQPAEPLALSKREIEALPHLAGDVSRALPLLPGVTANDVSAQFQIHGGRRDEVQILLDGQELYEAYHLQDFDRALSVVAPGTLASASLATGGFGATHGDRMSGVLDLTTSAPVDAFRRRLSVSLLTLEASAGGNFADERGTWLLSGRRGAIDLASRLLGNEDPAFWDLFGKLDLSLNEHQKLRGNLLRSDDALNFRQKVNSEEKRFDTSYQSSYLWLTHQATFGSSLLAETKASWNRLERDRRALEDEAEQPFEILDARTFDVASLAQSWTLARGERHTLAWGVEGRRYQADYDYRSTTDPDFVLSSDAVEPREGLLRFARRFSGDHLGAYATDRFAIFDAMTVELGARYDRHTLTEDTLLSPRVNVAWRPSEASVVRFAWGHFYQSHRPYELGVEDGITRFSPAERSEHWVLGIERLLGRRDRSPLGALRIEAYRRDIDDPRPRSENLFEPFNNFPEVEHDRVRISPESSRAQGIEVVLRGALGRATDWWVNYALAEATDHLHGREIPRQIDQRHTLNLYLSTRLGAQWNLSLAWRFHTGWPTTPVTLEARESEEGEAELVPVLGRLGSERLPSYHRMDLRLSRDWHREKGRLAFFVDLQNLYNRRNVSGFDVSLDEDEDALSIQRELSPGLLPSLGISWEF